jgi:hypothetical protein
MNTLKAIHVNWTPPQFNDSKIEYFHANITDSKSVILNKYTTMLSVLWWKKLNGGTFKLYTDSRGLLEYQRIGIDVIYDDIDVDILDNYNISSKLWTAGKMYSLTKENPPFCFLDNDLILRETISDDLFLNDVGFTHWELPIGVEYELDIGSLYKKGLDINLNLEFNRLITNTSFFYINNVDFQKKLQEIHMEFFKLEDSDITLPVWMFSDQVLPGQIIRNLGLSYFTLDNKIFVPNSSKLTNDYDMYVNPVSFDKNQRIDEVPDWIIPYNHLYNDIRKYHSYEHLWIFKKHIIQSETTFNETISRYKDEIMREFPNYYYLCN